MKKKLFIICAFAFNLMLMAQTEEQRATIKASYNKEELSKSTQQILEFSAAKYLLASLTCGKKLMNLV